MAENLGGVAAAGAAAAATGTTTGTPADAGGTGVSTPGGGNPGAGAGGAQPTQIALDNATPSQGVAPGMPKTWDVKVDGRIQKMTEAEMVSAASLGKAAFKRMEEANGLKSQVDAFWEAFQKDPMGALDNPALKLTDAQKRTAIEKYYKSKFIDTDAMTPEQKELAELKKWKQDKEDGDKKAAADKESQNKKLLEGQWRDHYTKKIIETLDKGGLPKNPKTIGRMAFYMQQNAKNKIDQTMEQVASRVRKDYAEEFQGLTADDAPVEALLEILGPNAVKKIQRYALDQHKKKLAAQVGTTIPAGARDVTPKPKEEPPATGSGWKKTTNYWTRHDK